MNFKGLATKIRAQAQDAVSQLPTFDDMAAQDDYIHSEEFNVRGQPRPSKKQEQPSQSSDKERRETSTEEAWSLLDRRIATPPPDTRTVWSPEKVQLVQQKQDVLSLPPSEIELQSTQTPSSQPTIEENQRRVVKNKSSSSLLLSVVADALEETEDPERSTQKSDYYDDSSDNESEVLDSSEDDHNSLSDASDDDEDPIMSLIRQSKPKHKTFQRQSKSPGKSLEKPELDEKHQSKTKKHLKHSNRFLDDLDQRLATPEDEMEKGMGQNQQGQSADMLPNQLGNWFKTFASSRVDRFLKRPTLLDASCKLAKPPLTRGRSPKRNDSNKNPEDDFHVTVSSSVLADDELAQLAKMKLSSTSQWSVLLNENRRYIFIAFTLILSAFVYYFSRIEDDVT